MSVTANGMINPKTIISGDSIKCFDDSLSVSETVVSTTIYVIDPRVVTATPGTRLYLTNANTLLAVDEIIIWDYNGTTIIPPTGFAIKTNYYVIEVPYDNLINC